MTNPNNFSGMFSDVFYLSGMSSPGVTEVKSFGAPRGWDKRKGYGISGAFTVYTGDELAEFTMGLRHWLPPDTDPRWLLMVPLLDRRPTGLPGALSSFAYDFQYPILNAAPYSIKSVVVKEVTPWLQDEFGEWSCEIKFLEFRAPLPALGKPDKTIPSLNARNAELAAAGQGGGDPNDLLIAKLSAQAFGGVSP
jgi:hypothetical protein